MAGALVEAGARHLVLIGRRPPGDTPQRVIAALEAQGAQVTAIRCDVSAPGEIEKILAGVRREMPPLRGVIHAAGVLADATLLETTTDSIKVVMAPKAAGFRLSSV